MFLLYTSGTTGKPKGIVHDTAGYLTQAYWTTRWNFDMHKDDLLWCTADIGWITGHTYSCYGPLALGSTLLIYEGVPSFPNMGRWWQIIDQYNVSAFYTAPTAIRMFMLGDGEKWIKKSKLSSLKILGTVGEPIDKSAWMWYFNRVGKARCPVIDTWWQTETGGNLINSLPGVGPFIPTVAGKPFPGARMMVVDDNGKKAKKGKSGYLVQASPFTPGMLRNVFGNPKKYKEKYFSKFKGLYDTSDGAHYDKQGFIRIEGRVDDVMKVAGHRLATAEVENAIDNHRLIDESAVVPIPDKIRGQLPVAFVRLKSGQPSAELEKQIIKQVTTTIGPTAKPAKIYFVHDLPKTRSGKIMRRILKNLINREELKGLMTLVNPDCIDKIKRVIQKSNKKK
jgi:acetyl-CoA synthetase